MIIATAGHVDHGKTALIKALTGQQTDRSAEELRRGMSIELGYAWLDCPDGKTIDLVDVPGHDKFMRTLLAGMGCVDAVMLVVAADDGVMPQTLEHLQLLKLLGGRPVLLVISKCASVSAERSRQVQQQVLQLLPELSIQNPPSFLVDSLSGDGIAALVEQLNAWAARFPVPNHQGPARMSIDRHFSQPGAGTIVTGTLLSGGVQIGDSLRLSDNGADLRIRSIQVHGQNAGKAQTGQRCALNLAGDLASADLGRGSQLLEAAIFAPTACFAARLELIARLPNRGTLQLHMGNAVINARCVPLKGEPLPVDQVFGQWVLERPVCCRHHERFIIRDPASRKLLGSGLVIDPFAASKGRQRPDRLAALLAMDNPDADQALHSLLKVLPDGVDLGRFMLSRHRHSEPAAASHADSLRVGAWLCRRSDFDQQLQRVLAALTEHHQQHADQPGINRPQLLRQLGLASHSRLLSAVIRHALDSQMLQQSGPSLHLPGHQPQADAQTLSWFEQLRPAFAGCAPRPPVIGELMAALTLDKSELMLRLDRLCAWGLLVCIGRNRYLLPDSVEHLLGLATELATHDHAGQFSTANFRDHSGIGRNHSVALLEYFDKVGLTRQSGQQRRLA
ncbi:MAG: selenocysteine-specific translation elongation factor [Halopseudomonas sp.]